MLFVNLELNLIIGAFTFILLVIVFVIFISLKKKRLKKDKPTQVDQTFLKSLMDALGSNENIVEVTREHKRLKIKLVNIKQINAKALQDLNLGAFLKGKEVTLLIQHHIEDVMHYLNENRKEV